MTLDITKLTAIAENAKSKTSNPRWIAAIEKASTGILSGELIVTTLFDGALVTSENGSYLANGNCGCKAFQYGHKECKHRAAARLWERYETEVATPATSRATLITSIQSAWSAKFPHDNLADNLIARFKVNQLEMLSVDFLEAINAIL